MSPQFLPKWSLALLLVMPGSSSELRADDMKPISPVPELAPDKPASATDIRFATFNASLFRNGNGELTKELKAGSEQAHKVATIILTVNPDVMLVNEFDYDDGASAEIFVEKYLNANTIQPWKYHFSDAVNTGVDSGLDLNRDGKHGTPDDAWGFGLHPGQYGMLVISRYPIATKQIRTLRNFRWSQMPDAQQPMIDSEAYYPNDVWKVLRLSSKSHWDVPIEIDGQLVHFLTLHPTPPVFDGKEDRNGKRNHDEIRLIRDYACPEFDSSYIVDDAGKTGGLATGSLFVLAGDQNADPADGDGSHDMIASLLKSPAVNASVTPASDGSVEASKMQGQANTSHQSDNRFDTCDFNDRSVGNLRCDYLLPSSELQIAQCGVFWPEKSELAGEIKDLVDVSDHRLVWADLKLPVNSK